MLIEDTPINGMVLIHHQFVEPHDPHAAPGIQAWVSVGSITVTVSMTPNGTLHVPGEVFLQPGLEEFVEESLQEKLLAEIGVRMRRRRLRGVEQ